MLKKYYPVSGGEVPSINNKFGITQEDIIKSEQTFMSLVTLRRIKDKVTEYLENNGISYTQIIVSPALDILVSEQDVINYPSESQDKTYNWGLHLDIIKDYVLSDLSCVVYLNGEDEEFIHPEILENLGIDLTPMIVNYNIFKNMIDKQGIGKSTLPPTFGEYKKRFIDEEVKEFLGFSLPIDILVVEKNIKRVL